MARRPTVSRELCWADQHLVSGAICRKVLAERVDRTIDAKSGAASSKLSRSVNGWVCESADAAAQTYRGNRCSNWPAPGSMRSSCRSASSQRRFVTAAFRHSGVSSQRRFFTAAPSLQNRPFVCSLKSQTKPKLHKGLRPRALVAVFGYEVNAPLLGALQVTEYVDTGTQK